MAKNVKDAYGEILRLRNDFYQKWQEVPHEVYDENRGAYKAKYEAFDKALELLTPSIVDHQPEEPMTADKVNLDRCICDIDLVASAREDCERIRKHIRAIRRIFAGLPEELSHTEVTKASDQEEPVSEDLEEELDRYLPSVFNKDMDGGNPRFTTWFKALRKTALHFAIWQKQQIMKDAVDAFIYKGGIRLKEWPLPEKCGKHLDPVKVIIIKKD